MGQAIERRQQPRFKCQLKVSCIGDYRVVDAEANDISLSGALLSSPVSFEPGEEVVVVFNVPTARRPFSIPARVIRTVAANSATGSFGYGLGVQYFHLSSELLKIFNNFFVICSRGTSGGIDAQVSFNHR